MKERKESGIFLSLGSNLGDRRQNLALALRSLENGPLEILQISSLYETAPVDLVSQPDFFNAVIEVDWTGTPRTLLEHCLRIEGEMGRTRDVPKGPRIIDLDILYFKQQVLATPRLRIPHSALASRRFVLTGLLELAPDFVDPLRGVPIRVLFEKCSDSSPVERLDLVLEVPRDGPKKG